MTFSQRERERESIGGVGGWREKLAFGVEGMEFSSNVAKPGAHRGLRLPWFAASWDNEWRRFFCCDNNDVDANNDGNPTTAPTRWNHKSSWCSNEKSSLRFLLRLRESALVECLGGGWQSWMMTLSLIDHQRTHTYWELVPYERLSKLRYCLRFWLVLCLL